MHHGKPNAPCGAPLIGVEAVGDGVAQLSKVQLAWQQ